MIHIVRNPDHFEYIEKDGTGEETSTIDQILNLYDPEQINSAIRNLVKKSKENLVEKNKENPNICLKLSRLFYKMRKKNLQHILDNDTFLMCYETCIVNSDGKFDVEIFRAWSEHKYYDLFQGLNGESIGAIREICDKMTKNEKGESTKSGTKFWTTIILSSIESFDEKYINLEDILSKYFEFKGSKNFSLEKTKESLKKIIRASDAYLDLLKKYLSRFNITEDEFNQLVQEVSAEKQKAKNGEQKNE